MPQGYKVAIVGATGAVGRELLQLMETHAFPVKLLRLIASERSIGKTLSFQGELFPIHPLKALYAEEWDFVFLCAGSTLSRDIGFFAYAKHIIDCSSAFRLDASIPLVIPEINGDLLCSLPPYIASPNCTTTLLLMALYPIHLLYPIKRAVVSTYQAASGGGFTLIERLKKETQEELEGVSLPPHSHPYGFNLFLHSSSLNPLTLYNEEENKVILESQKILQEKAFPLSITCVRVPVMRAHAESVNLEFTQEVDIDKIVEAIQKFPGLCLQQNIASNQFATPKTASFQEKVFVGRIRKDLSLPCAIDLWIVGDQLLKGSALNAIQIAEKLVLVSQLQEAALSQGG